MGVCFENNSWRALTPYDRSSVMHYPWCNGTTNSDLSITSADATGVRSLYGAPSPDTPPISGTRRSWELRWSALQAGDSDPLATAAEVVIHHGTCAHVRLPQAIRPETPSQLALEPGVWPSAPSRMAHSEASGYRGRAGRSLE